jgi:putative transposase
MNDKPEQQNRHTIRLKGYNYAQEGMYFFTICTYKRQVLFGTVASGEMQLNEFGQIVCDEWRKTAEIRHEIGLDTLMVMPNHLHGIVLVTDYTVGATGGSPFRSGPSKHSLGSFIAGFKSAVTTRINKVRVTPQAPIWQRNYYEHVIRDEESLNRIREYILNNPAEWDLDPENPASTAVDPGEKFQLRYR